MLRHLTQRPSRALALVVIVAGGLLTTALGPSATATMRTATSQHATKATIVLVHGAWADSSSWNGVVGRLERKGYAVVAAPNPLRSLSGDSAYVRSFLSAVPGPIVLVGHSYGGAVISNAATGNPNVKGLVYIDAFAPDQGETVNGLVGAGSALAGDPTTLFDIRSFPTTSAGDADVYLKPSVLVHFFAQDLPKSQALALAATQRPLTLAAGNEPSGTPAWRTIRSWYLLGTKDKIITPTSQRAMATRAHSHIVSVPASHVSLISHPAAVTDLVIAAARAAQ